MLLNDLYNYKSAIEVNLLHLNHICYADFRADSNRSFSRFVLLLANNLFLYVSADLCQSNFMTTPFNMNKTNKMLAAIGLKATATKIDSIAMKSTYLII